MLRTGRARDSAIISGTLSWKRGGDPAGSIGYTADLCDPESAFLELRYTRNRDDAAETVKQRIRLCHTRPNYGGRRWWAICPYRGHRVLKLYLPPGGDRFASARAWRLAWKSQRIAPRDRPFEAVFRLQQRLGGELGYDAGLPRRPKGMWNRTYERHWQEYEALSGHCEVFMAGMMLSLLGKKFEDYEGQPPPFGA